MSLASDQLAQLYIDIAAAQKGSYREGSRSVTRENILLAMYKRAQYLEAIVDRENGTAPLCTVGQIDRPR